MPAACAAFGGQIPPIGTLVGFDVVVDQKTGRPRAESVLPFVQTGERSRARRPPSRLNADVLPGHHRAWNTSPARAALAPSGVPVRRPRALSGTMSRDNGRFGFIEVDDGSADMFVMPAACASFGGMLPPLGTRISFDIIEDVKTGKPRAEHVQLIEAGGSAPLPPMKRARVENVQQSSQRLPDHIAEDQPGLHGERVTGAISQASGKFGFIRSDAGEEVFVLPSGCSAFGAIPAIGTRVSFEVTLDPQKGRALAQNVCSADDAEVASVDAFNSADGQKI